MPKTHSRTPRTMTQKKPVILVFISCYLPGYRAGGPIRTLANMVERLSDTFNFYIVTRDRDLDEVSAYPNITPNSWTAVGKAHVMYLSPVHISQSRFTTIVNELSPDCIYLNGFFNPRFTQRVLWARRFGRLQNIPVLLAPRGEFSEGALQLKQGKKKLYLKLSRLVGLYRKLDWQASSVHERDDISRNYSTVKSNEIHVAMNLAPVDESSPTAHQHRAVHDPLRLCFLSRISPKKNLDFALRVLSQVKCDVVFSIYGPKEDADYWKRCDREIQILPDNIQVIYKGEVHPDKVKDELAQHDMFFFPTRGENYGHVIHEALGAGLPVLLSDQTPWKNVAEKGVGWMYPLKKVDPFVQAIASFAALDQLHAEDYRKRAHAYAKEKAVDADVLDANVNMFLRVIARYST